MEQRRPPNFDVIKLCGDLRTFFFWIFRKPLDVLNDEAASRPPTRLKLNYFIAGNSLNHAFMQFPDYIAGIPKWGICQFICLLGRWTACRHFRWEPRHIPFGNAID